MRIALAALLATAASVRPALTEAKFAIIPLVSLGCCAAGCRGAENKPNNLIGVMPAKGMKCRTANWRSLGPQRR